ncbi:hypothetical protein GCM10022406_25660 [Hymenobacter algoricola]|uniref:Secreted protein n=1 Tax=Hymenobacter algoricola TaxID=486267 RepID=A0ABP7N9N2_9BACT
MYSTIKRTSHGECGSGLPRMWRPLSQLRFFLLIPVLLLVRQQREQWKQRVQTKSTVVETRFSRSVHAYRGAGAHADPREY